MARYTVGIDLGTTNCAIAFCEKENGRVEQFHIPQEGSRAPLAPLLLPSCLYFDEEGNEVVGQLAKELGVKIPTRFVHSAKSWLSNPAAARKERILPEGDGRISPVEATARYLDFMRLAWNKIKAKNSPYDELEEQEIILTIPASFDEVARKLTLEAATMAGLRTVTLLEEPQAAFYNWLLEHHKPKSNPSDSLYPNNLKNWNFGCVKAPGLNDRKQPHISNIGSFPVVQSRELSRQPKSDYSSCLGIGIDNNSVILVCDIGGGTTDFSLIEMRETEFMRMAVGNHLLLGGDNMDHALAYHVQAKIGQELDTSQWLTLIQEARNAKEILLNNSQTEVIIWLGKSGSHIVGGGIKTTLSYEEVEEVLLCGFFGLMPLDEATKLKKSSGIKAMGLPFESDPSITKHLAAFLSKCERKPTAVLFNGGAIKPQIFQKRIIDSLEQWFGNKVTKLPSNSLDLAVCRGATYFGKARYGNGVRIQSGTPRSYYLKVRNQEEEMALTLLSRGAKEGTSYISDYTFSLLANEPVSFELFHSHTRLGDVVGSLLPIDQEQMLALPLLQTLLKYGKKTGTTAVKLKITLSEIGTIELQLISETSDHKWLLEFSADQQKVRCEQTFDTHFLDEAKKKIQDTFTVGIASDLKSLIAQLEKLLESPKAKWSPSILRAFFEPLLHQSDKREIAAHYEIRFWNLIGFFLRPGMGYPMDDHRIKEVWKIILADAKKVKSDPINIQKWICYRRIAAGLSKGQQSQLFNAIYPTLFQNRLDKYAYSEKLRALASFELVETIHKIKLGNALLKRIEINKAEAVDYWALGRLGARQLMHGSIANVVAKKVCEDWLRRLLKTPWQDKKQASFTLALLIRKTDSPSINVSEKVIKEAKEQLDSERLPLIDQEHDLTIQEQECIFGESLPIGLGLVSQYSRLNLD